VVEARLRFWLPAKVPDSLLILGLAGWITVQESWIYGIITAPAFFLNSQSSPPHKRHLGFAPVAPPVTLIAFNLFLDIYNLVAKRFSLPSEPSRRSFLPTNSKQARTCTRMVGATARKGIGGP